MDFDKPKNAFLRVANFLSERFGYQVFGWDVAWTIKDWDNMQEGLAMNKWQVNWKF